MYHSRTQKGNLAAARRAWYTGCMWYVYMLRCADGSLYTGSALDVDARAAAHNRGRGAKYTRSRLPVSVVYREEVGSRGEALSRELFIKGLTRAEKEALLQ